MKLWKEEEGHLVPTTLHRALSIIFALICWGSLAAVAALSEADAVLKMVVVALMTIACIVSIHDTLMDYR